MSSLRYNPRMSLVALLFLLGAAGSHATWNYLAKGTRTGTALTFGIVLCSLVVFLPLVAVVFVLSDETLDRRALAFMAVSGGLHTTYFYLLNQGYRAGDLSLVYPLSRGTGPAFAVVGAVLMFGERPGALAVAGILLVIAGVLVLSVPREIHLRKVAPSIAFSLATGVTIAAYTLWDKQGVSHVTPVVYAYGIDTSRLLIIAPLALSTAAARAEVTEAWRTERRAIAGIGVLTPAAYMMVLAALVTAPVSYVAPAREISILFGAAMGLHLLGESYPVQRLSGAAAVVSGVLALALG